MTTDVVRPRGQPLLMLALLFMAWIGGRALMWESPFSAAQRPIRVGDSIPAQAQTVAGTAFFANFGGVSASIGARGQGQTASLTWSVAPPDLLINAAGEITPGSDVATGQQQLVPGSTSHPPVPFPLSERIVTGAAPDRAQLGTVPRSDRWSLEAWAFLRDGSGSAAIAQGRVPSYGASQAAAVLNFRLAPASVHDPRAYARVYRALIDGGEKEIAAGLSARPMAALPVRMHAELRATRRAGRTEARPAAFVTSELAPQALPLRLRAEAYVQAGYVGGRDGTGFVDGQVHVLRDVGKFDLGTISLGTAAWGGAQEGAERFDLGPSLRVDLKFGKVPARLALDYRERVVGNAEPASGAALTLSTRF